MTATLLVYIRCLFNMHRYGLLQPDSQVMEGRYTYPLLLTAEVISLFALCRRHSLLTILNICVDRLCTHPWLCP